MAKYLGLLTSDMRGKIGGLVASRGRTGTTLKAKAVPSLTGSLLQQQQRMRFSAALQAWRALGVTQRTGWGTGALALLWSNSLGTQYVPTGLQLWQQCWVNAALLGTVPPSTYTIVPPGPIPILTATLTGSAGSYTIQITGSLGAYTTAWLAFMSPIISASKNYTATITRKFAGGNLAGDSVVLGSAFEQIWGPLPAPGPIVSLRLVPVDPASFMSGTPFILNMPFST